MKIKKHNNEEFEDHRSNQEKKLEIMIVDSYGNAINFK